MRYAPLHPWRAAVWEMRAVAAPRWDAVVIDRQCRADPFSVGFVAAVAAFAAQEVAGGRAT